MRWLILLGLAIWLGSAAGEGDPGATTPTAPTSTTAVNPGGGHCGYGAYDNDVRDIPVQAVPGPNATNHC